MLRRGNCSSPQEVALIAASRDQVTQVAVNRRDVDAVLDSRGSALSMCFLEAIDRGNSEVGRGALSKDFVALQTGRQRLDFGSGYEVFPVAKLVSNSSPKLGNLGAFLSWSEPEKQSRQWDLAF
jgi:hypothetical protein